MIFKRVVSGLVIGLVLVACSSTVALASDDASASEATSASHGATSGGHGEHGSGDSSPLSFKKDLALWTAVVFLVLLAILWKFAWGPIVDGLDKREQKIAGDIASAERINEDARRLLAEYQQKLAASEEVVRKMIDDAKRDAERVGQQVVDKARAEAEVEHKRALDEIDQATASALKELAERSATLAVNLAGKIVQSQLDPKAHSRLIEQAVADFSTLKPGNN